MLKTSKLAKFKNSQLNVVWFGPANKSSSEGAPGTIGDTNRAKMMISVDQSGIYRMHKLKGIQLMADKDFSLCETDFGITGDPDRISNLKAASYRQLKAVRLITDYVFCTLLTSSRLNFLDPVKIQLLGTIITEETPQPRITVNQLLHHQGLVIAAVSVDFGRGHTNQIIKYFPIVGPDAS